MKTIPYDGKLFMVIEDKNGNFLSAVRPDGRDRLAILNIQADGTFVCRSRTVSKRIHSAVEVSK